ncbi:MAG: DUF2796 domain-containing protein [Pseudomonadota bacterium]
MIRKLPLLVLLCAASLGVASTASAQAQAQHAHVHGLIKLDIAIEGPSIVIAMESPLDNLVGFERAPRTDAERQTVEDAVATLRAADKLFDIDPAGNCKLGPVNLQSPALGLGQASAADAAGGAHADLDATLAFNCTNATAVKYIDVSLFTAFKGPRQIDVQIASPKGQFQRSLKRPNTRLAWGK